MTLQTIALLAFLSVNLKVIFLALPILPSHVSPQHLRITFLLHMALYKFFLYCTVLYCMTQGNTSGSQVPVFHYVHYSVSQKKPGPLQLISHNFTNSQRSLII